MKPEDARAFVDRDWGRVAEAKAAFWVRRKRALGPAEGLRVSEALRLQVLATHPGWPDAADRAADLEAHARLSRRLQDASAAGRR
jgi:hypothetical protein